MIEPRHHIRIARPVRDLDASEEFYVRGLGLSRLERIAGRRGTGERDLLMAGPAGGHWHLELTASSEDAAAGGPGQSGAAAGGPGQSGAAAGGPGQSGAVMPTPTPEDLLVLYLGSPVPEDMVSRAIRHGGTVVPAHNPYWDSDGVTIADPDGYRVVLTGRSWDSSPPTGPQ